MATNKIVIREFKVEQFSGRQIELIYTPDHTQVLQEGRQYRIVFSFEELPKEEGRDFSISPNSPDIQPRSK